MLLGVDDPRTSWDGRLTPMLFVPRSDAFAVRSSAVSSDFVATALTDVYAKGGCLGLALKVFDEMPHKNVVSWTTLVASLTRAGRHHEALRRFSEMRTSGVHCDSYAYATALKACADAGLLSRGREVHAF
ncbi:hypothetical protein E2562_011586 [Oryza meyeriana var. granulata]|uniref:Pentatricopeptide repeat-containing protein n=1 Tax=Oryza meyeriana var. granulata TaxID=110450 RepID=A0A6G1DWF4_9ORYZ|nr:hypothetical protein E2562_011586 [Oryza meyeriana var. granulata]